MEAHSLEGTAPLLSKLYVKSMQRFRCFLLALNDESCCVMRLQQLSLVDMSDEYGRAKVWGDQSKVELPNGARGSLDDTLRHDNELKRLVQGILMRLGALLGQATVIAKNKYDLVPGSDHDSISSDSGDSDSSFSSEEAEQHQPHMVLKICLLVEQIKEQIGLLYDLSSLLRRPSVADKYIRSVNSKSNKGTHDEPDILPLLDRFSELDRSHAIEKVLHWRAKTKSCQSIRFEDEDAALVGQECTNNCVEDILWYCQRLARANTRRREQLQYWREHPYNPEQDSHDEDLLATPNMVENTVQQRNSKGESQIQASSIKNPGFKLPHAGPKSSFSKQSFSTAAASDVFDSKTNVRAKTEYTGTNIGQGRSNHFPNPPKTIKEEMAFPCPYCGMTLESREMQNKQSWKRHVYRDLRPYVCTFEDCQNSEKLYVTRHDWIHHEVQIHRRKYVCKECNKMSPSRKEMSQHLQGHYGESLSPAHLGVILDFCHYRADDLNSEKEPCLVCVMELSLSALQRHVAAHMEETALFVLPNTDYEDDARGSNDSVQLEIKKSGGRSNGVESEASSLDFSSAGSYEQALADISKLLASEEASVDLEPADWITTDDDQEPASTDAQLEGQAARLPDNWFGEKDWAPPYRVEESSEHSQRGDDQNSSQEDNEVSSEEWYYHCDTDEDDGDES